MDAGISRFFKNFDLKQKLTGNLIANNSFFISTHNGAFDNMDFKLKNEEIIWAQKLFYNWWHYGWKLSIDSQHDNRIEKQMEVHLIQTSR